MWQVPDQVLESWTWNWTRSVGLVFRAQHTVHVTTFQQPLWHLYYIVRFNRALLVWCTFHMLKQANTTGWSMHHMTSPTYAYTQTVQLLFRHKYVRSTALLVHVVRMSVCKMYTGKACMRILAYQLRSCYAACMCAGTGMLLQVSV